MKTTLAVAVIMVLASCKTKPYVMPLMPTPELYAAGSPFDTTAVWGRLPSGVLYATDREPEDLGEPPFFGSKRGHILHLGTAKLGMKYKTTLLDALEDSMSTKRKGKYEFWVKEVTDYGTLHATHGNLMPMKEPESVDAAKEFSQTLRKRLRLTDHKEILIYVHGYKTIFEQAALVAGQIWHYVGYEGVSIGYSWPATPSRWAYGKDIETSRYATRNFRIFLNYLASHPEVKRVHIIGYSAGTRLVLNALHETALMYSNSRTKAKKQLKLGQIILVGSDVDRGITKKFYLDGIAETADNFSIYVSEKDRALTVSRVLLSEQRLGQFDPRGLSRWGIEELKRAKNVSLINVTRAKGAHYGKGHSYFINSPWASSEILLTLGLKKNPGERGLEQDPKTLVWSFPQDYAERLRKILKDRRESGTHSNMTKQN